MHCLAMADCKLDMVYRTVTVINEYGVTAANR